MSAFGLMILSFLKKHWLPIALIVAVLGVWFGRHWQGYTKGKAECEAAVIKAVAEESQRRSEEVERVRSDMQKRIDKIRQDRYLNPKNDKRDSCILSNDPFSVDCLKDTK